MTFSKMHSKLLRSVINILLMGSKPKVSWIYAWWIVAFVTYHATLGAFTGKDLVGEPVSPNNTPIKHEGSVTAGVPVSNPFPTLSCNVFLHSFHQANPQVECATTLVPMNKSKRDTLYPPISFVGSRGHFGALTAATLTDIIFHGMTNKPAMVNSQTNNIASIVQS